MQDSDEIKKILGEIRDAQLAQLAEYRKVTQRSLELQQQAVNRQEKMSKLYRVVVLAGSVVILLLVVLLVYLLRFLR
jgi:CHASE3 domain sensor protein